MSTQALFTKMLQCFVLARRVNHFYWVHTAGDDSPGATSIENIQRVVSRLAQLYVYKRRVQFEGSTLRGNIERYEWGVIVNVRASQTEAWQRFTVIKELCHVLLDTPDDWSTDVVTTISDLLQFEGFTGKESAEIRSEKLAEVMAVELLYPVEFRRRDKEQIAVDPASIIAIAEKRGVPPLWIERAIRDEYLEACEGTWQAIATLPNDPTPLGPEVERPEALVAHLSRIGN